ncbi:dipeptidase [Pseudoxanthomonas suwonensis]|uniref:Peptidase M19 n=1 Tax=Pseudoxanthomonas suwonensis TaxID=314722 RepID=A0A0E3Z1L4_9GAMM|nr:dipeptidase [Pseudoxanthomonas suwonensis]AKC86837.1 peptidase M19 [Pseudoxanthomonas suwonensis]
MKHVVGTLAACLALACAVPLSAAEVSERAARLHQRLLVLDTHLDTPANFARPGWSILDDHTAQRDFAQVDLPRMRKGGLDGGFWVVYTGQGDRTPEANRRARDHGLVRLAQIREMVAAHPDQFELALRADDARRIADAGKRVVYISMENATPLASDPSLLSAYHALGLRMLGITHMRNNEFGDSSNAPPEWNGLSPAGKALVAEANRLGIVLDASHASDQVFDQLLELSRAPFVLSHSGADALYDNPRNIDDARLRRLAENGGVIHVNAYGGYLVPLEQSEERKRELAELDARYGNDGSLTAAQITQKLRERDAIDARHPVSNATFDDYMNHVLHLVRLLGPEHVGIGADWDGGGGVAGLEDVGALPRITQALLDAGYSEEDIANIWSGNVLRVLGEAERVAKETAGAG